VEWLMGWPVGWTDLAPLDASRFGDWKRANRLFAQGGPDPWFDIDPATLDSHSPGFVPRMAAARVPNRAKRIEALGNGQVPRCVVHAWQVLRDEPAANDDSADMPRVAAGGIQS
jgi:hypothetical protein